jgi:CDP-diacylglycerol--inositol 3-phosphatidyltransferase
MTNISLNIVLWWSVLSVTGAICFAKQFISVVQIINASKTLAIIDQEERAKINLEKSD